jgi:6-pyruvoyltetrahydropterin/6-carboxytetrahydropterin synthase
MPLAYLTRVLTFSAAHRYHRPDWSEARNREVFGACANPVGHGHTYTLEVTVRAPIDPDTGFSADLSSLDALLRREVTEPLDHQHLNHAVDAFHEGAAIPTTENILAYLWPRIVGGLQEGTVLHRLRLREEPGFHVDYFGGGRAPGDGD